MTARIPAFLVASLASALVFASPARAEEIRLVSGATYDARDVSLLEKDVRFSYSVGGGHATIVVPMERLDARNLIGLLSARANPADGGAQLAIARLALSRGLLPEAAARFRRAAAIDPTLAGDRDAGLASIVDAETETLLKSAEQDVRRGRTDLAAPKAKVAFSRAIPGSPLALRAESLLDLSLRLADRDRERAKADALAKEAFAVAAAVAAFDADLAAADTSILSAVAKRAKAADPGVSGSEALHHLESADVLLRDGRRSLSNARPLAGVRVAEVDKRDVDALALLVANHLDLADLYRQDRRFDRARDRVRSALLLDPSSVRAQQTTDRIEADLRTPVPPPYGPYGPYDGGYSAPLIYSETFGPAYGYGRGYGRVISNYPRPYAPCRPCAPTSYFGYRSSSFGLFFRW